MTTTPRPWPEGTRPTATQLDAWLRRATGDERLEVLDRLLAADEAAHRCIVLDHDNLTREADHARRALYTALIAGNRYRLAWTSARRRAAAYAALLDGTANPIDNPEDPTP